MDEDLTTEEIYARYPSEWVLLGDPQTDERLQVLGGKVLCHSKDRDEVYSQAIALPAPKRIAFLYTGPIPAPGMATLL
jgi:hypothetical protein